jgi:hypothetical protein
MALKYINSDIRSDIIFGPESGLYEYNIDTSSEIAGMTRRHQINSARGYPRPQTSMDQRSTKSPPEWPFRPHTSHGEQRVRSARLSCGFTSGRDRKHDSEPLTLVTAADTFEVTKPKPEDDAWYMHNFPAKQIYPWSKPPPPPPPTEPPANLGVLISLSKPKFVRKTFSEMHAEDAEYVQNSATRIHQLRAAPVKNTERLLILSKPLSRHQRFLNKTGSLS